MNSRNLHFVRLRQNKKHQYGHIKSILDWTVMVYLVIPAVIIGALVYRSWWLEMPDWIEGVSFPIVFAITFLFLWRSHFQTYIREADQLFLMKNERLILGLKQVGILYSYFFELLNAAFIGMLIGPFWLNQYGLNIKDLIMFLGLWVSLKWLIMAVKGKLNVHLRGWRSLLRGVPLFIGAVVAWNICYQVFQGEHPILISALIIMNTFGSVLFVRRRFTSVRTFEQDLAIDELVKNKYIGLIFSLSMDMEKLPKPVPIRKSPRLYSKSNRLFNNRSKRNGFLELFIKAVTRNVEYILGYLQIVGVTSVAMVIIPPIWLKVIVASCGFLFLLSWTSSVWHTLIGSHPFTKRYAKEEAYFSAKKVVTTVIAIPYFIFIGFSLLFNILIRNHFPFF